MKLYTILKARYLQRESGARIYKITVGLGEKGFLLLRGHVRIRSQGRTNRVS